MSHKEYHKLIKASDDAVLKDVQHILVAVKPDGTITINGSNNTVNAVLGNAVLYSSLQDTIINNRKKEGEKLVSTKVYAYSPLPVSPFSPQWKGSGMIRKVLDSMVTTAGYGKYGQKLGQGAPPLGWPVDVAPWEGYIGAARPNKTTNRSLSNHQMTQIIVSMLQAVQLDPATHIIPVDNAEGININIDVMANAINNDDDIDDRDRVVIDEEEAQDDIGEDLNLSNDNSDTDNTNVDNNNTDRAVIEEYEDDQNHNRTTSENPNKPESNLEKLVTLANDLSEREEVVEVNKRKRYI